MKRDIGSGLVVAAIGVLVTREAAALTYRDEFGPGPGLLPFWLGLILCALAVVQIVLALRSARGSRNATSYTTAPEVKRGRVVLAAAGLAVMAGAVDTIGFISGLGLLSFFLVYVVERRSLPRAAAVAVSMMLGFLLLFRVFLPIPLP
jgi:hypothetical protein